MMMSITLNGWMATVEMNLKGYGRKLSWHNWRYYPDLLLCLEGLKKINS
jgi:hypothetical protein